MTSPDETSRGGEAAWLKTLKPCDLLPFFPMGVVPLLLVPQLLGVALGLSWLLVPYEFALRKVSGAGRSLEPLAHSWAWSVGHWIIVILVYFAITRHMAALARVKTWLAITGLSIFLSHAALFGQGYSTRVYLDF